MAVDTDELRDVAAWSATQHGSIPARAIRAAADEIDRLRRWKAEAIEVLGVWDEVHRVLGSPASLGQSKAAASKAEVMRLSDEIDRLRGAIRWHRLAAQEETGADLDDPMNFETFDRALWSVLDEGEE